MEDIFNEGKLRVFLRGDIIDPNGDVFYVQSGSVAMYSRGEQANFIFAYKKSDVFPIVKMDGLFLSNREIEYRALSTVHSLSISKDEFMKLAFTKKYAPFFFSNLMDIMEFMFERIDNLSQGTVKQRLLNRLVFIADRLGTPSGESIIIEGPMSHNDLASSINTSRETVNRIMKDLEKSKIITLKNQIIVINSLRQLKNQINFEKAKSLGISTKKLALLSGLAAEGALTISDQLNGIQNLL